MKILLILIFALTLANADQFDQELSGYKLIYDVSNKMEISKLLVMRNGDVLFAYRSENHESSTMMVFVDPKFKFPVTANFMKNNEFFGFSYQKENSDERIIWSKKERKFKLEIIPKANDVFSQE
jgi:hypothetical protein